jgi:hypothetical protein
VACEQIREELKNNNHNFGESWSYEIDENNSHIREEFDSKKDFLLTSENNSRNSPFPPNKYNLSVTTTPIKAEKKLSTKYKFTGKFIIFKLDTPPTNMRKCENPSCELIAPKKNSNTTWNKVKNSKGKTIWLCAGCYKAYKKDQFCYYCMGIYKDSNQYDGKSWIGCDYCKSWVFKKLI